MKKNTIKILSVTTSFVILLAPILVFAQIKNPLGDNVTLNGFIGNVLGYIVKIGSVIAIFAFIYSGFLFVQAQGNPEGLKTAKTTFKNTCIGVAVLLGAQLIASIIVGTIKGIS